MKVDAPLHALTLRRAALVFSALSWTSSPSMCPAMSKSQSQSQSQSVCHSFTGNERHWLWRSLIFTFALFIYLFVSLFVCLAFRMQHVRRVPWLFLMLCADSVYQFQFSPSFLLYFLALFFGWLILFVAAVRVKRSWSTDIPYHTLPYFCLPLPIYRAFYGM